MLWWAGPFDRRLLALATRSCCAVGHLSRSGPRFVFSRQPAQLVPVAAPCGRRVRVWRGLTVSAAAGVVRPADQPPALQRCPQLLASNYIRVVRTNTMICFRAQRVVRSYQYNKLVQCVVEVWHRMIDRW